MYRILVVDNEQTWNAQKGYSDILELERRLASTEQRLERLQLPEKGLFGLRHYLNIGDFNQKRFQGIQQYFTHLAAQLSSLADSPSLSQFFSAELSGAPLAASESVEPIAAQATKEREAQTQAQAMAKAQDEAEAQAQSHAKAQNREAVAASTEKKAPIVEEVTKAPFMLNPSVGTWLALKPLQAAEAQAQAAAKAQAEAEVQARAQAEAEERESVSTGTALGTSEVAEAMEAGDKPQLTSDRKSGPPKMARPAAGNGFAAKKSAKEKAAAKKPAKYPDSAETIRAAPTPQGRKRRNAHIAETLGAGLA